MISKNLFIKLSKEDMKRRSWVIALFLLMYFMILPIMCALTLEQDKSYLMEKEAIVNNLISFIGTDNFLVIIATVGAAIIIGISGFCFLHSKKKVDLYHSLPISRGKLFAVNYVNGFIMYLMTYLVNIVFTMIVIKVNGYLTTAVWEAALMSFVLNIVFFTLIYTLAIIAVLLTGNVIISILGTAVFLLYGPTLMLMKELYFGEFFQSYYTGAGLNDCLVFLSPVGKYMEYAKRWAAGESVAGSILSTVMVTLFLIGLAILLYRRRPSEASGAAMAFFRTKPVIKIMLVVLLTLGGGIIFKSMSSTNDDAWFLFGLIFSLLLFHSVIEIIYDFDFRSAIRRKRHLLYCLAIVGILAGTFRFDLFHYDSYLPEETEIETMSIAINGIEDNIAYRKFYTNGTMEYINANAYQLEYMKLNDFKSAYELVKLGINQNKTDVDQQDENQNQFTYQIKYTLKNKKEVFRSYAVDTDQGYSELKRLFSSQEYKKAHYPIHTYKPEDIGKISLRYYSDIINDSVFGMDGQERYSLSLDSEAKQEFLSTYKAELNAMNLDELINQMPVMTMQLEVSKHDIYGYYIYPSFTKTLALISEHGIDTSRTVDITNIKQIDIADYSKGDGKAITYYERQDIEELMPYLIDSDYYYNNAALISVEDELSVYLSVFNKDYNRPFNYRYYFKKGCIPDKVIKEMQLN